MMNKRWLAVAFGVTLAAVLAGCGSAVKLEDTPVETRTPTPAAATAAQDAASASASATRAQSPVATVDLSRSATAGAATAAPLARVVYFDFDSAVIKDEFRALVDSHAKALSADKTRRMLVEGHTDERGGSEYNLALGQRRAEAVQKAMLLLGVTDNQLEAVSYGKERPVAEGHDEASWAKNRRAELKDR
jgi:peptidoglycan-associated lipoprotein